MRNKTQQPDRRTVHRKLFDVSSNKHQLCWNRQNLLTRPVECFHSKYYLNSGDKQPEIAIWLSKPEVLISPTVWQISSTFQRQTGIFDIGEQKNVYLGDSSNDRQPEMTIETGNTYISETMRDTIKTSSCKSGIYDHREFEEESVRKWLQQRTRNGNSNMAAKTGNTHISGTVTYTIEILKANLSLDDCNNDRQPEMTVGR